jgi:hypothetical protein
VNEVSNEGVSKGVDDVSNEGVNKGINEVRDNVGDDGFSLGVKSDVMEWS